MGTSHGSAPRYSSKASPLARRLTATSRHSTKRLQERQKESSDMIPNDFIFEVTYRISAYNQETNEMMHWSAVGEEEREKVERFLCDCRTVRGIYEVEQW